MATSVEQVSSAISMMAALSVAVERFVEVIKGLSPKLDKTNPDEKAEKIRQRRLQLLAVLGGIIAVAFAYPVVRSIFPSLEPDLLNPSAWGPIAVVGLMASGGSGFWNAALTWVKAVKDIKKDSVPPQK